MVRIISHTDPLRLLLVEDSKGDAILIEKALKFAMPESYIVTLATTLEEAMQHLSMENFDVCLLDRSLPDVDGFEGLHSIQNMAPELPVVFLTAYKDEKVACEAIEQGAQDYLYKDEIDGHIVRRAVQYATLRKQFEGVLILRANYDMLTELANRLLFESRLEMAIARMKRQGGNASVLFIDLDEFKHINDTYGHAAGDVLLKQVADRLKKSVRPYDTSARFGGDEFAVLLENLPDPKESEIVAEKIIHLFDAPFFIFDKELSLNVSIGIAHCSTTHMSDSASLMQQADKAMYQAKTVKESAYRSHAMAPNEPNLNEAFC